MANLCIILNYFFLLPTDCTNLCKEDCQDKDKKVCMTVPHQECEEKPVENCQDIPNSKCRKVCIRKSHNLFSNFDIPVTSCSETIIFRLGTYLLIWGSDNFTTIEPSQMWEKTLEWIYLTKKVIAVCGTEVIRTLISNKYTTESAGWEGGPHRSS